MKARANKTPRTGKKRAPPPQTLKTAPGSHPSAHEQYRPHTEQIALVREVLEPFGLEPDDNKTWAALEPIFIGIAHQYNFRSDKGAIPRPGRVTRSFTDVMKEFAELTKAGDAFVAAIGAIDDVALEWMLAYADPVPLFARAREGAKGPSEASEEFRATRDAVFGPDLEVYSRVVAQMRSEFFSWAWPSVWALDAASRDFKVETIEFTNAILSDLAAETTQRLNGGSPSTSNDLDERKALLKKREQSLKAKERALITKMMSIGAFVPPTPYFAKEGLKARVRASLDESLHRLAPIAELSTQALQRFSEASPNDKGGNNISPFFLGNSPKDMLVKDCCSLISYTFGSSGLKKIKASKHINNVPEFLALLRAVHECATGKRALNDEFSEAMKVVVATRDQYLNGIPDEWRKETAERVRVREEKEQLGSLSSQELPQRLCVLRDTIQFPLRSHTPRRIDTALGRLDDEFKNLSPWQQSGITSQSWWSSIVELSQLRAVEIIDANSLPGHYEIIADAYESCIEPGEKAVFALLRTFERYKAERKATRQELQS